MAKIVTPDQIIAVIHPEYLENPKVLEKYRAEGFSDGVIDAIKSKPVWENRLNYDSTAETLEPVYFWLLDLVQSFGWDVEKISDNFTASPGSGYFAEIGARATKMQEEGMKILGTVNAVIKSIINLLYDLKEFEIRLKHYEDAESGDETKKEAGLLALKQIWMDNVDIKRGRGSINQMSYELGFVTLRDAFMMAKSAENVNRMDLNERVKRVLEPRISEFYEWMQRSGRELKNRYNIEIAYLKSQVDTLKLYVKWVKPYLKAAKELGMGEVAEKRKPWLVNAFSTMVMELSLLNTSKFDSKAVIDAAYNKKLPEKFIHMAEKNKIRTMYKVVLIDFAFRGIPRKVSETGYAHGGRVEIYFRAYILNEDELKCFKEKLSKNDLKDALNVAETLEEETLKQITEEIDGFLKKDEIEAEAKKKEKAEREANPFTALFEGITSIFKFKSKEEKKEEEEMKEENIKNGIIEPETHEEKVIRNNLIEEVRDTSYKFFDLYKKAHGMAAFSIPPEYEKKPKA